MNIICIAVSQPRDYDPHCQFRKLANNPKLQGVALGAALIHQVGERVVAPGQVASAGRIRGDPSSPHRRYHNGAVVAHAFDNGRLRRSVKAADAVESGGRLAVLVVEDLQVSIARNGNLHVKRLVAVNGATEVSHGTAAPRVASAGISPDLGVHGGCSKFVALALNDVELNACVALVHEVLAVVAVEVRPTVER